MDVLVPALIIVGVAYFVAKQKGWIGKSDE